MTSQQGHDRLCMGSEHLISGCKFGEKGPKLFIYAKLQHKGIGESYPALRVCKNFFGYSFRKTVGKAPV